MEVPAENQWIDSSVILQIVCVKKKKKRKEKKKQNALVNCLDWFDCSFQLQLNVWFLYFAL